jgi:hypothetical protein
VNGIEVHEIHLDYLFCIQIGIKDVEFRHAEFVTVNEQVAEQQSRRDWL